MLDLYAQCYSNMLKIVPNMPGFLHPASDQELDGGDKGRVTPFG